ncbi:Protein hcp1 [BD1-7 clade bacterium]|uniref:Protein hcp1 n=1 Tax=BD1-7 clade bacterium TaxID=2029982 RepID=A0A5S9QWM4_9GAMM|nr:Protein hcp1 [BD1-7 clade bacterium]
MATDMFIKIDGVKGESVDSKHKNEIDILGWSWGISQSGSMQSSSGGGAGRANVQDLSFTKYTDKSTALLVDASATGKHLKKATITVRKAGEKPLEYLTVTLEDVMVSSVSLGGAEGNELLTENVTLNFAKYTIDYIPQSMRGAGGAAVSSSFDAAKNMAKG